MLKFFLCVLCVLCGSIKAADTLEAHLPPGGFVDVSWQDPFPGKWEILDVTKAGITPGETDQTAALQKLFDGLTKPTIVSFPAGTFRFNKISINKSNVILKGARPGHTIFKMLKDGTLFEFFGKGGKYDYKYLSAEFQPRQIAADVKAGGTEVPLADTKGLAPGDMVLIEEDLDQWTYQEAKRCRGGVFLITKVDEKSITLDLPLALGLEKVAPDQKNATLAKLKPLSNVGLESVRIECPEERGDKTSTLFFKRASNAYVHDVEIHNTAKHHVEIAYSRQVIIESSYFDQAKDNGGGGTGYGINLRDLSTHCLFENNIFRDLRHTMATETGASYSVFAYNLNVDRVRDLARTNNEATEKWVNNKNLNGIANMVISSDVVAHGNMPHSILLEGNVFYNGVVDRSHTTNGTHLFFRNCALGQPKKYGGWQEGAGLVIMGSNDDQVLVGNVLRNDASILIQKHDDKRTTERSLIGGNVIKGQTDWGALAAESKLPASLFLKEKPGYWTSELAWPAFGPDVQNAATTKIPAQVRYEEEYLSK